MLSADEIIFAGATKDEANKTYYLHNAEINYSIVGEYAYISKGAKIGEIDAGKEKITVVASHITIGENKEVESGAMVEEDR